MNEDTFILDSCVRGYHVYKDLWNATPGETLTCIRERGNRNDVFAVAVQSDGNIVGHVPRHISCICKLFIHRGLVLNCLVTGTRRYSSDLPQGGMEIPCQYIFSENKDVLLKRSEDVWKGYKKRYLQSEKAAETLLNLQTLQ